MKVTLYACKISKYYKDAKELLDNYGIKYKLIDVIDSGMAADPEFFSEFPKLPCLEIKDFLVKGMHGRYYGMKEIKNFLKEIKELGILS